MAVVCGNLRMNIMRKTLKTMIFSMALAGCSGYGGEWPRLNDPLPDASERSRINDSAPMLTAPSASIESESIDLAHHKNRQNTIVAEIEKAWQNFDSKIETIKNETDRDDKHIAWSGSQLALSRVSDHINTLRALGAVPIAPKSVGSDNHIKALRVKLNSYSQRLNAAKDTIANLRPQ